MSEALLPNLAALPPGGGRIPRLISEAFSKIPADTHPIKSVSAIELTRKSGRKGLAALTTYRETNYGTGTQKITFYLGLLSHLSDRATVAIIAHELAHAWLNEYVKPAQSKKREKEADELARKWGFSAELLALEQETVRD
jgi:Zn-dependent protease with chaperone function